MPLLAQTLLTLIRFTSLLLSLSFTRFLTCSCCKVGERIRTFVSAQARSLWCSEAHTHVSTPRAIRMTNMCDTPLAPVVYLQMASAHLPPPNHCSHSALLGLIKVKDLHNFWHLWALFTCLVSRLPHASLRKCHVFKLFHMHLPTPLPLSINNTQAPPPSLPHSPSKSTCLLVTFLYVCCIFYDGVTNSTLLGRFSATVGWELRDRRDSSR